MLAERAKKTKIQMIKFTVYYGHPGGSKFKAAELVPFNLTNLINSNLWRNILNTGIITC